MSAKNEEPTNGQLSYIVINAIDPYKFDLHQIIAMPDGFRYRNRFDQHWVSAGIQATFSSLSGRCVLVIRDKERDVLYPIRHANIVLAQRVGRIFYIEYELDALICYDSNPQIRQRQVDGFNVEMTERLNGGEVSRAPNEDMAPLVFKTGYSPSISDSEPAAGTDANLRAWGNLLDALHQIEAYKGVEFVRLIDVRDLGGNICEYKRGRILLAPEQTYSVRVFQLVPRPDGTPLEPHDIQLRSDGTHIAILRGVQRAVGRYDVLTFTLRTGAVNGREEHTYIEVAHAPGKYSLPAIHLPVLITLSTLRFYLRWALAALLSLVVIAPEIVTQGSQAERVRAVATILLILTISDRGSVKQWIFQRLVRVKGE